MKKKRSTSDSIFEAIGKGIFFVFVGVPMAFIVALIINEVVREIRFDRVKTGVTRDGILRITDDGTASMGSNWETELVGDAIELSDEREMTKGFFTGTSLRQVWEYQAVSEGTAMVLITAQHTGSYRYTDIYRVTVDDRLNISYESHRSERIFETRYDGELYKNGVKRELSREEFDELTRFLCGTKTVRTLPPEQELDGLTRLKCNGKNYFFDTESGIVYIVTGKASDGKCQALLVDEWVTPQLREKFE